MPEWLGEALMSALVSTGVLSIVLPILLRFVFQARLESFKSTLARDLESHKADLSAAVQEHSTRFSALHERRTAAIADIYRQLLITRSRLAGFVSPAQFGPEYQERLCNESIEAVNKLIHEDIKPNLILFDTNFAERLEQCGDSISKLMHGSIMDVDFAKKKGVNPYVEKDSEFAGAWDRVRQEIDPMLEELATEFRKLLSGNDRLDAASG